ncbi:MAG TPA: hypothetical protein PKD09_06210 [Aggregatilinea sp.]|jgi:hypothetical protein|uniref:hypothetical protein n=1 Tax=Aggregatilinea sp. TaxID=2806333 RepID=UPI002BB8030F|nr:hypothetical protein [Aggregatilinea sp.]HML21219.1 hypothetical protein [Aggregatilinea sp.]
MRRLTCDPKAEISGASLSSILENSQGGDMRALAAKFGLEDIRADAWYPLQKALEFWDELSNHPNLMSNLVATGLAIVDNALVPEGLAGASFEDWVKGWDAHYQANFRNADVGHKSAVKVSPGHYMIVLDGTVIPDDLEYGVLYGFARRLLPSSSEFTVWYDENETPMDEGGDRTILHVEWA